MSEQRNLVSESELLAFPGPDVPIYDDSFLDSIPHATGKFGVYGEWTKYDTEALKLSLALTVIMLVGCLINRLIFG
jgi:hypothetical protein